MHRARSEGEWSPWACSTRSADVVERGRTDRGPCATPPPPTSRTWTGGPPHTRAWRPTSNPAPPLPRPQWCWSHTTASGPGVASGVWTPHSGSGANGPSPCTRSPRPVIRSVCANTRSVSASCGRKRSANGTERTDPERSPSPCVVEVIYGTGGGLQQSPVVFEQRADVPMPADAEHRVLFEYLATRRAQRQHVGFGDHHLDPDTVLRRPSGEFTHAQ